jgi:hypothetical protein
MTLAIGIAVVLLFFGGCIAVLIWSAKKQGWATVLRFVLFAILGRVLVGMLMSHPSEGETVFVPLLCAGAIVLLWPHIVKHRMQEVDPDAHDRPESGFKG